MCLDSKSALLPLPVPIVFLVEFEVSLFLSVRAPGPRCLSLEVYQASPCKSCARRLEEVKVSGRDGPRPQALLPNKSAMCAWSCLNKWTLSSSRFALPQTALDAMLLKPLTDSLGVRAGC